MNSPFVHQSVLLHETIDAILGTENGIYVDATFGRGGHSRALLARLGAEATVIAFDKDPAAIAVGQQLMQEDSRFQIIHASFAELVSRLEAMQLVGLIDGVMADLGVSSPQLDDASRGFSFMNDGPLDMRMDTTRGISAAEWLLQVSETQLADVLFQYGEERYSRRIAKAIKHALTQQTIHSTKQLAEIVAAAHPAWERHKHPATRSFQAIRIAINQELDDIQGFLPQSLLALKPLGKLAVISFHSLEDRLVKQFLQKQAKGDDLPRGLPVRASELKKHVKILAKVAASPEEVKENPRARSAHLRVAQKLAVYES
ncbi:16S rRNA (cytosine(1402)-N(4))-methyltransferase RsmH [Agitococcus lubricus]|uniref:Ribosomal RNA small subunit methyltransferase H n=1 Tax=Agitococcus lubricus TaxID=1077255 RepID=A0A2T5J0K1_9GAMM|nr:16S rRNA (cytosine(1402)-N(4))-methyltransferase RsmH [Agitococcus lubricus]PTQ89880.1 16S rRNA (cytosine1402-N4)-methyltransferase [Agitococcus lubricus]